MVDDQGASDKATFEPPSKAEGSGRSDVTISPYVGGGGGSTLGHRVATSYLADMLLQEGRPETEGFPVVAVPSRRTQRTQSMTCESRPNTTAFG